jgi:4'-phosphopantetheinyl transferase
MTDDWRAEPRPPLDAHTAHVWRVALDHETHAEDYWPLLSAEERARAQRFHRDVHRRRYVVAHGALRIILAGYLGATPDSLAFVTGEHGKPALRPEPGASPSGVEFNLSHSDDLALVAVTRARPIGVDLERWSEGVEHLELAERFFSPEERGALRGLAHAPELVAAGFFAAWTRKEAYLKATGHGIARGLHHFDVTLAPGERARLLADRLDRDATERWSMTELAPAPGYSAALVVASPLRDVLLFTM